MTSTPTCALTARELHEPVRGTAPVARGWLLVEQPGPWGHDAVLESRLSPAVGRELTRRTADLDVRVQLIRRVGGRSERQTERRVFLVHAGPSTVWTRRLTVERDEDLLAIDPDTLLTSSPSDLGTPHDEDLLLVCTHAKRDACCARFGRPLATQLAGLYGDAVWETSHVGGHRFAANLLILPHGLAFGYVEPEDAQHLVSTHRRGLIDLPRFRGRSSYDRFAQVADIHLREHTRRFGIDDVVVEHVDHDDDEADVTATAGDERWLIRLRRVPTGTERLTGCDKTAPADPGVTELVELVRR